MNGSVRAIVHGAVVFSMAFCASISRAEAGPYFAEVAAFDFSTFTHDAGESSANLDVSSGGLNFSASASVTQSSAGGVSFHTTSSLGGTVTTSLSPSAPGLTPSGTLVVLSRAGIRDTVTINSAGHSGSGVVSFQLSYNGTSGGSYVGASHGALNIVTGSVLGGLCSSGAQSVCDFTDAQTNQFITQLLLPTSSTLVSKGAGIVGSLPFTYGTPLDFSLAFLVVELMVGEGSYLGDGVAAFIDFGHTSTLEALTIYDNAGLLDGGASVTSASGLITYDVTGVPEPLSAALFCFGLVGIGAIRRRKAKDCITQ